QGRGYRLEMLAAMLGDVPLVSRLGELRPAAPAVAAGHVALQANRGARPTDGDWREPRALRVHERDHGLRTLGQERGQGTQDRRGRDDERRLERDPRRQQLAQGLVAASEERHAVRLRMARLADQRLALALDPVEGRGEARRWIRGPGVPDLAP